MFSFPFCWSIGIHVLLVIVFEITEFSLIGNSYPSNEACVNVSGEIVCFFKGSAEHMIWNDAWQLCRSFSATLPVIRNRDEQNTLADFLKSREGNTDAWTAGRKAEDSRWIWIKGGQLEKFDEVESNDEIQYTNWDENRFSNDGECISICASDGKWKARGCGEYLAVVCQTGQGMTSALTTEKIQTRSESSTLLLKEGTTHGSRGSIPQSSAASEESITHGSPGSPLQSLTFLALVAAIVIIICLVVFVLKTKFRSLIAICNSKSNNNSTRSNPEELHSRTANAYAIDTCVNEHEYVIPAITAVERSDDTRDDYEEISSLQLDQSEDGATEQQPGSVYASLAKETSNMEPDQKCAHPTSPTKIGPLGDIYAMPDANVRSGIVSGANNRPNHPIKVTAQGDVYALPMQRSKPSTSNNPGEIVYVNLPTEMLEKEEAPEAHVQTNASSNVASRFETAANGRYQNLETTRRQAKPDDIYTKLKLLPLYEEVCQLGN